MARSSEFPPPPSSDAPQPPTGPRWRLPRLPVLVGVVGLGALVTTGNWFKREVDARHRAELHAIQTELVAMQTQAEQYQQRIGNLRWNAAKMRAAADATNAEPLRSWALKRASLFEALVATVAAGARDAEFGEAVKKMEDSIKASEVAAARERLLGLRPPRFPSPTEFRALQDEVYLRPLAMFSRQNPDYYRALQINEPDVAKKDVSALRGELAKANVDEVNPQSLATFEVLSAVLPLDDPVLVDWAALSSAAEYFDAPDPSTLKLWREARKAMRLQEWPTAYARMQSIALSTVRTRQPFRAAYGRTILKNRPDQTGDAYPLLLEAAVAGDAEARSWVANEDLAQKRYGSALRWLEARVAEGERAAVEPLLKVYAMDRSAVPRDLGREVGLLQKMTVAPDAPPLALMLLARLYQSGEGTEASAEKAFRCLVRAAEKTHVPAFPEVAECLLKGTGTPTSLDGALDWAARAYAAGEREKSVPILMELMQQLPDRTAAAIQDLFEHEQIAAPAGFRDRRSYGPSVARMRLQVAKFLDQKGSFGAAARLYAQTAGGDAEAAHRHAELTLVHPCEACGGDGKIQTSVTCPTCGGKGSVLCGACDGRGYNLIPGAPPCATCGGSGHIVQEGRNVTCSTCAGTGKGKGSVTKQPCSQCAHGRAPCRECEGGRIKLIKECPECRGVGARALADR
ncbi:MAG: hypothetical protein ABIV50_08260 [Opitutus sp.]